VKTYYELLDVPPTATIEEIKRAFRQQIARYHPDKVQHLGKEFQDMAAERAAELTEAYRILSDDGRRAEYDRGQTAGTEEAVPAAAQPAKPRESQAYTPPPRSDEPPAASSRQFASERATRDEYVRKAAVSRFRQAFAAVGEGYDQSPAPGFDMAWLPKSKLFARGSGPRVLMRFTSNVDHAALATAWTQARTWSGDQEVCVFLIGFELASPQELGGAIAEQRRRARSAKVTIVPVNGRTWEAHVPTDAPAIAKSVLARLKAA
jgi:curved DNA-binding protein CbpA